MGYVTSQPQSPQNLIQRDTESVFPGEFSTLHPILPAAEQQQARINAAHSFLLGWEQMTKIFPAPMIADITKKAQTANAFLREEEHDPIACLKNMHQTYGETCQLVQHIHDSKPDYIDDETQERITQALTEIDVAATAFAATLPPQTRTSHVEKILAQQASATTHQR